MDDELQFRTMEQKTSCLESNQTVGRVKVVGPNSFGRQRKVYFRAIRARTGDMAGPRHQKSSRV